MANNNSNSASGNNSGGGSGKKNFDGLKSVADMLNFMDKESREKLLANLARSNEGIVREIRQKMFEFEDLIGMDGAGIQFLLKEIPPDKLKVALRTASEELTNKILANMSIRAADLLREDLANQGPLRQSTVNTAQAEIMAIASQVLSEKMK